jgi:Tfp pilus assembly protein PilX
MKTRLYNSSRAHARNEKGSALIVALAFSTLFAIMVAGYLQVTTSSSNNEAQALNDAKAFNAAESGRMLGLNWYNQNNARFTSQSGGYSISNVVPVNLNGYDVAVDLEKTDGGTIDIQSRTLSKSQLGYYKKISQEATYSTGAAQTAMPFTYAGFGKSSIALQNGNTDSYNSGSGAYGGANVGSNGDIGTNGTGSNVITIGAQGSVKGDANTGAGGTISGENKITGTINHSSSQNYPSVSVPAILVALASNGTISGSTNLTSGNYKYDAISIVGGNRTLNINANQTVTMYVTGNLTIGGNAKITLSAGAKLTMYINGTADVGGGGVVNNTSTPSDFLLCSTYSGASTGVDLHGGGTLYGGIYAPDASVRLAGNGTTNGSVIAKSISANGNNASIHYDEAMITTGVSVTGPSGASLVAGTWKVENKVTLQQ